MKIRIVEQSAELLDIPNPLKKIERCARVCYQSFDKEGEGSDIKLCSHLVQRGHTAMLEHFRIYVRVKGMVNITREEYDLELLDFVDEFLDMYDNQCMSLNLRTLFEWYSKGTSLKDLAIKIVKFVPELQELLPEAVTMTDSNSYGIQIMTENQVPMKYRYVTFDIMTNRGITHELVRHRKASFAQESTRYCAYREEFKVVTDKDDGGAFQDFLFNGVKHSVLTYKNMLDNGVSPQIARGILPNVTAAQIIVTMRYDWWQHFLSLRSAPGAHPTVRELSKMIEKGLDELIDYN